jgi:hypothetical protein
MLPRSFCITPSGKVHALVKDRHRSREFFEFLKLLDAAYPASTAIKLILDNRAAHISKETKASVAAKPATPSNSPSIPSTIPGSISSRLFLQTRPLRPVISASHPNMCLRIASGRHLLLQSAARRSHLNLQA